MKKHNTSTASQSTLFEVDSKSVVKNESSSKGGKSSFFVDIKNLGINAEWEKFGEYISNLKKSYLKNIK